MYDKFKEKILKKSGQIAPEIEKLSDDIYHNPELSYEEYKAYKWHTELLEKYGFEIEHKLCDIDTAFLASYDSGKPGLTIAYLAEYDALPGIGHGCGHNMLGATSTAAGILLKEVLEDLGGKVYVYGTPAEETDGGKNILADKGKFDDVNIAMMSHPETGYRKSGTSLAMKALEFEFFGKATHASSSPEEGINALNAAVITVNSINALREHIRDDSRIHGILIEGGEAPNIVPEYSRLRYYVRSKDKKYNEEIVSRVENCARAGALATGCQVNISLFEEPFDNLITNKVLMDIFEDVMKDIYQVEFGDQPDMGSLDIGKVSQVCPTIHTYFDITNNDFSIVAHTREMAECTTTDYAKEQMMHTACALALTAVRVLMDPKLYDKIMTEFNSINNS
jgi:amidohydrolase